MSQERNRPAVAPPATLFRPVRELLADAMMEVRPCTSRAELLEILKEPQWDGVIELKEQPYDRRIGWHSHLVCVRGWARGFLNGTL